MTHRKTELNARRCIVLFVVFSGFTFDFSVTATLITASHVTVHNERIILLCTFIVGGRVTSIMSLVIALVIRVSSALVIRAPPFPRLLLLIADFVRVSIRIII